MKLGSKAFWTLVFLFWSLVIYATITKGQSRDSFVQTFNIHNHEAFSYSDIQFLELRSSKGTLLLSGDKDLELIKFLKASEGTRIIISVEVPEK